MKSMLQYMNLVFYKQRITVNLVFAAMLQGLNYNVTSSFIQYEKTMLQSLNLLAFHFLFHRLKVVVATNEPYRLR